MRISSLIKCIALAGAMSVSPMVFAEEAAEVTLLTIHLTNGTDEQFNLPDEPVMTVEGQHLRVKSSATEALYLRSDIDSFDFAKGKPVTSIDVISADFMLSFVDNNVVTVKGNGLKNAMLHDINGRTVKTATVNDSTITLDLSDLPKGVYVLSTDNGKSFKLIRQ